jgi:hydrogenase nickel incorporation protein HypA/HybF
MHEYSIVAALIGKVAAEAAAHRGARVHRLHVEIGELAGVEIDLLALAYETFRAGTACDGAALEIHPVPVRWVCPGCKHNFPSGAILRCEACDRPARLGAGGEIILARIEMEVPDV